MDINKLTPLGISITFTVAICVGRMDIIQNVDIHHVRYRQLQSAWVGYKHSYFFVFFAFLTCCSLSRLHGYKHITFFN